MKKQVIILAAALLPCIATQAQEGIYNNGSVLQINGNATVQVNGNFTNNSSSNYINEGTVKLQGNFINHQYMAAPSSGTLLFEGNTAQILSGNAAVFAKHVLFNNGAGVSITDTLLIDGNIDFVNGIVQCNDAGNPVVFTANSNITTAPSNNSHIKGWMVKQGNGNFNFPVGDGNKFQPVLLNLATNSNGMMVKYNAANAGNGPFTNAGTEVAALTSYNQNEYWNISPWNGGTATGTVTVYWDGYKDNFSNSILQRKVAHQLGGNWLNEGNVATGNSVAGSVTSNAISTWGRFALGNISTPLPLQLLNFSANALQADAQLIWKTTNEINVSHFVIERSIDGIRFTAAANKQAGSSYYQLLLRNEAQYGSRIYYRLKMIDANGAYRFSNIVWINFGSSDSITNVYPNPVINNTTLQVGNSKLLHTKALLTDAAGKTIKIITVNSYFETIEMNNLPQGMYMLQLANGNAIKIMKE